jgi:hypothetical protein
MSVEVDNIILQVGHKASGKTEFCKRVMNWQNPRRCLVLDFNYEYNKLDTVELGSDWFKSPEDWNGHKRIALWEYSQKEQIKIALKAIKTFKDGLLIIEDANMLTRPRDKKRKGFVPFGKSLSIPEELVGLLSLTRSRGTRVIINTHCYAWLTHPKIGANCGYVMIRKTPDSIERFPTILTPSIVRRILQAEKTVRETFIEAVTIKI